MRDVPRTGNASVAAAVAIGMGVLVACRTMPPCPATSLAEPFSVDAAVSSPRVRVGILTEVNVDECLEEVFPSELSPQAFPQIEALKAQAVAARTIPCARTLL